MSVANKSSKYVWAYQAAHGTPIITEVGSTTYEFGEYTEECGKWNTPFVENESEPHYVYSSRTPSLTDLDSRYPTFSHVFCPVTAQFMSWMLGLPADTNPTETDTVTITTLNTGRKNPLTIRCEELEGTNPQNAQAGDCHCIAVTAKAERDKAFMVECEFAWGELEDIGDNPNLTTPPGPAGGLSGIYDGNPYIMWDIGGDNVNIPGVWRADFSCRQEFEVVSSDEGTIQSVYTYKMEPVKIILNAIFAINDAWDDYVDRKASTNMTLKVTKHDGTSNILFTFTNCRIVSIKKTGARNKGHYASQCTLVAEKVEAVSDFFTEGGSGFSTHWKVALA